MRYRISKSITNIREIKRDKILFMRLHICILGRKVLKKMRERRVMTEKPE